MIEIDALEAKYQPDSFVQFKRVTIPTNDRSFAADLLRLSVRRLDKRVSAHSWPEITILKKWPLRIAYKSVPMPDWEQLSGRLSGYANELEQLADQIDEVDEPPFDISGPLMAPRLAIAGLVLGIDTLSGRGGRRLLPRAHEQQYGAMLRGSIALRVTDKAGLSMLWEAREADKQQKIRDDAVMDLEDRLLRVPFDDKYAPRLREGIVERLQPVPEVGPLPPVLSVEATQAILNPLIGNLLGGSVGTRQ